MVAVLQSKSGGDSREVWRGFPVASQHAIMVLEIALALQSLLEAGSGSMDADLR
jgi:hypothetical protein